MPTIYDLKPRFQTLLRPLVARLAARGVTPNQVTLAALMLSLATGALTALGAPHWRWPFLAVPAVLFVRMALNAIDGMLAREHGMQTPEGAILNEVGDVLSDAALYLPLALIPGVWGSLVVIAVVMAVISEMTGVAAVQIGAQRRYDGPMGKSDRALTFGIIGLLVGLGFKLFLLVNTALAGVLILLGITIKNRARQALQEIA
ncbi:MAG: CDP-alcohol phosphatidyltransferase family protein [Desulfobacterales bacterium]|nr:CDP-alcohol phosphatidyltransferase family protein [Desulfobacterales bacterium]